MQQSLFDLLLFCASSALFVMKSKLPSNCGFADTTNEDTLMEALKQGTTLNATENVCTVDENNVPSANGHARSEMRLKKMWHRATYIVVRHVDPDESSDATEDNTYLLIQRRSSIKDYCPSKLDPTPGGVVGFGESYEENAQREMLEEMSIDVGADGNSMRYLFSFPYQDDKVKVWGGMFEVIYTGPLSAIKMQPEEVSEILRLSIKDIRRMAKEDPDDWMPDGLYAIQLYLQKIRDEKLNRRMLKGYSSGNLNHYSLRPKPEVIFFDCDDCLYFDGWILANELTAKIELWCTQKKGLKAGYAYDLYKKHGTALRGLLAEGHMDHIDEEIDQYLKDVHDLPIHEHLSIDNELRDMILKIDPSIPKFIFTASVRDHAERCLRALGIDDLFVDIIDVKSCNLATKHSTESFEAAMRIANVKNPESCIFLDDSIKNIEAARAVGWRSYLVGRVGRDCGQRISTEHSEGEIDKIHDLPHILPELFEYENE